MSDETTEQGERGGRGPWARLFASTVVGDATIAPAAPTARAANTTIHFFHMK